MSDILIVIEDGVFSHAYGPETIYIVDLDDNAEEPIIGASYNPNTDLQKPASLREIDSLFNTTFSEGD